MKNNDKGLNLKIPTELYNALQQAADRKYISLASAVRIACAEWVENNIGNTSNTEIAANGVKGSVVSSCDVSSVDIVFAQLPHTVIPESR